MFDKPSIKVICLLFAPIINPQSICVAKVTVLGL